MRIKLDMIDNNKLSDINIEKIKSGVQAKIKSIVELRFSNEMDPEGNKWKKPKHRKGKALADTGYLKKSIHDVNLNEGTVGVGTNAEYAAIHNYGGVIKPTKKKYLKFPINGKFVSIKQVNIPKRQFFGFNESNIKSIKMLVNKLIKEQILKD
ncbi:phage virion morphogenesis protein [Caviibacter abscessus]|uniref:phage virion morphogenesis protein n=1 Tax=Caviibacter abscessus TaxID=1766719 RepID=UPI000838EDB9|nr:phage virion morphogenesis protein [Caviibacter abscessus]